MRRRRDAHDAVKVLSEVSRVISSSLDLDKVSDLVLKESINILGADHASLFLLDDSSRYLILTKAQGFSEDEMDNIRLLGSWEIINDQVVTKKKSLIVNNTKHAPFSREKFPVNSFLAVPLEKDGKIIGILMVSNRKRPGQVFTKDDERLLRALSNHIAIALLNARLYQELKSLFISTVKALVKAVDAKDRYTSGHSERVMKYSIAIGRELKLDEEVMENIGLSSLLHDVGKIGIKESILSKPARLLGYERSQIKRHPAIGVGIVETIDNSHKIIKGILEHHERFDGKGYPKGLKGNAISLAGRIIAVADVFDALTASRPYQKGYSKSEALSEITKESSSQFDPKIVKAFLRSFSSHPDIWDGQR